MTENEVLKYLDNLHSKIVRSSFADNVTENEITALIECKNLEKEIQQYRAIGTVEECREAREKQRAKKAVQEGGKFINYYKCPICDEYIYFGDKVCKNCGQAIRWSDTPLPTK